MTRTLVLAAVLLALTGAAAYPQQAPLALEAKIPLGAISGRIDHMAVDLARRRLIVAELGNDSVGVVDLARRVVLRTLTGFDEPQGVGFLAAADTIYVANGGDGSVRAFAAANFKPLRTITLDRDADNVRIDDSAALIYVGHGDGGIAVINRVGGVVADIALPAHPESFQLDAGARRIYVNLPDADQIAVIDVAAGKRTGAWAMQGVRGNFPMALERTMARIVIGTRRPPRLLAFAMDGKVAASAPLCGDADDIFIDAIRSRVYATCGEGVVDVFDAGAGIQRIGEVRTAPGARTSLWVPALDRLFVAVRASGGEPAAIWVLRPSP
ncbi:MAG: YncE family protein [Stellaceae bacterium]